MIESLLPVGRLSAEVFRERSAGAGQTLTGLGSYWKGRKPLVLNKACALGCLLPATANPERDLEIFELLMGMDDQSLAMRLGIPAHEPLPSGSYRALVAQAKRSEEVPRVHDHIWNQVNAHLGTTAGSFPELVEQLGVMRFGHRPRIGDAFSGSGQISFEAARLGFDVSASDLNPIACMLTWGALHVVGGSRHDRERLQKEQTTIADQVLKAIDGLAIETDGNGWRAKAYLYCLEVRCPQTGWLVPLLPSRVISYGKKAIAVLIGERAAKRYRIEVRSGVSDAEVEAAAVGTMRSDGRGQDPYLIHTVDGAEFRTKISTIRGDYKRDDGSPTNRLRQWTRSDFRPGPDDIFQERLYAVNWMRPKAAGRKFDFEFRGVDDDDLRREAVVEQYLSEHFDDWQARGWIPDMRIEPGTKTDEPVRTRGWTYWHHLFPPRHLLLLGLIRQHASSPEGALMFSRILDYTSKLCRWSTSKAGSSEAGGGGRTGGASDNPSNVFYNQALNAFYNYGCRGAAPLLQLFTADITSSPCAGSSSVVCSPAAEIVNASDIWITDPPYGDAVCYDEILEFFIAWLRRSPPKEFAGWTWDSRRALAIKGEDEDFRRSMVAAYSRMAQCMPENGIQVVMFTHQSGTIWADMANIVWASGLQVTAAWYVVTETESALREGGHVKGTVLLVLRKRQGRERTTRDDLAWDLKEEVESQVALLTGISERVKALHRDENLFADADLQMAGYAAALRVLTKYSVIDGKEMAGEAIRPRVRGETTFVDELIDFAVGVANQTLVPRGIAKVHWDRLAPAERFYCKMIELERMGSKTLDNYQNFAKAFKVRDFKPMLAAHKANNARLKSATEFGRAEMGDGSELAATPLRAMLYATMELQKGVDGAEVLTHMSHNVDGFFDATTREVLVELADYLATNLAQLRPEEASAARVLSELLKNQRM